MDALIPIPHKRSNAAAVVIKPHLAVSQDVQAGLLLILQHRPDCVFKCFGMIDIFKGVPNISSMELEETFRSHPAVREVAVHAVLADMEDDVKVTCTLNDGVSVTEEELCKWSQDKLPYFAIPRFIEFRDVLPKNPVGRVLKYQLRDEGVTPTTWDIEKSDVKLVKR